MRLVALKRDSHVLVVPLTVEHKAKRLALCAAMPAEGHLRAYQIAREARLDDEPREISPTVLTVRRQPADSHVAFAALVVVGARMRRVGVNGDKELLKPFRSALARDAPGREVGEVERGKI